jgi:hypothetical protein
VWRLPWNRDQIPGPDHLCLVSHRQLDLSLDQV